MKRSAFLLLGALLTLAVWAGDPSGTVVLAAKDAKLSGDPGLRYQSDPARLCIGHWTNLAGVVTWTFNAPEKRTYRVVVSAACVAPEAGSEFEVAVGSQVARGKAPATPGWGDFVDIDLGPVMVRKPGEVAVTVRGLSIAKRSVLNLRAVKLVPES